MGIYRMHGNRWWACIRDNRLPDIGDDLRFARVPKRIYRYLTHVLPFPELAIILGIAIVICLVSFYVLLLIIPFIMFVLSLLLLFFLSLLSMGRMKRILMLWQLEFKTVDKDKLKNLARDCMLQGAILAPVWMFVLNDREKQLQERMERCYKLFNLVIQITLYTSLAAAMLLPIVYFYELMWLMSPLYILAGCIGIGFLFSWVYLIYEPQARIAREIQRY